MNTKKMQVLYLEQTGHILAVFTRTAAAESLFDVNSSPDTDLLVRNLKTITGTPALGNGETLSVPMDLLKAEIVDLNENAFVMPFNFMVGGGEANDLRSSVPPDTPTLTLTQADITINVSAEVAQETKVWAQIQEKDPPLGDEPIRRIVSGVITPKNTSTGSNGKSVKLLLKPRPADQPASIPKPTAPTQEYYGLVLVAGKSPLFFTKP